MTRNILVAPVRRVEGQASAPFQDLLAVEDPLEIRIGGQPVSITMRTPGNDRELAAGFLFSEGIIAAAEDIAGMTEKGNTLAVELSPSADPDLGRLHRNFYMTSSCGVCGKASIEALHSAGCTLLPRDSVTISSVVIHALPQRLRETQAVFDRTGGLHGAALFDIEGRLLAVREDVGRHNALDKLIGAEFLAGRTPLHDRVLLVSGRVSFELVQKALMAGIPILAAVGAPSSLAVELAGRFQMTLAGFVRDGRFNVYCGEWRIHETAN
ncbi:MAG TPA: formate dehydrogenase accessory sulfurtransferase FdhD [Bryobacteraceae bacterium]|nr:formate dehydrogenase accessory sulfurtransferase FdhD [Bryobacteraceae bacterium]